MSILINNAITLPADVPNIDDDFADIIGWTIEEEEAFMSIRNNVPNDPDL